MASGENSMPPLRPQLYFTVVAEMLQVIGTCVGVLIFLSGQTPPLIVVCMYSASRIRLVMVLLLRQQGMNSPGEQIQSVTAFSRTYQKCLLGWNVDSFWPAF